MFYPVLCVPSILCSLNPNSARSDDYQSIKAMKGIKGHILFRQTSDGVEKFGISHVVAI